MPYKIVTRITVNEGGEQVWEANVGKTQEYMAIQKEYIDAGDMDIVDVVYGEGTRTETVLWRTLEARQEYGDRGIALLGGNPRTDPAAAALLTPNTIEVIEEGEITEVEYLSMV